ncbi:hypothetical protein IFR05_010707 [Cadophora sp. M221]|nr:hypothetical protein IFR05_010707 [Cadophora sp. M221]
MRTPTLSQTLGFSAVIISAILLAQLDFPFFKNASFDSYVQVDYGSIIGIDLGLKYSRVGVVRGGQFEIISDDQGRNFIPSVITITESNRHFVRYQVQENAISNPKNIIYDIRNLIGGNFSDPAIKKVIESLPYEVVEKSSSNGSLEIKIRSDDGHLAYSPEYITSMILTHLKTMAQNYLNTTIKSAVITVPTYFSDSQRQIVKAAGWISGLDVLRIANEPSAAAIAHRLDLWEDCGGDHAFYGGQEECNFLIYDIQETESDLTLLNSDRGVFEVKESAHHNVESHSRYLKSVQYLPAIMRSQLNKIGIGTSGKLLQVVKRLLANANLDKTMIDGILVTGNPTLAADAQRILGTYFGSKKIITSSKFPTDQAIVCGAAMQGALISESWPNYEGQFMDVTHLSMGIEAGNGVFHTIVQNGTVIPTRKSINVSTTFDNQEKVVINIWEGQRLIANKNRLMGTLELAGLSPRLKGVPDIEVTLEVDANRILRAFAREVKNAGENENRVEFVLKSLKSLYVEEIVNAMYDDAKRFDEEDSLAVEKILQTATGEHGDGREEFGVLVR